MAIDTLSPEERGMVSAVWWVPLILGIIAMLFGLLLFTHTNETVQWIAWLVGFWWLVSGVINLVSLAMDQTLWGWKLFSGVLGVLAGLLVLDMMSSEPLLAAVGLGAIYVFLLGFNGMLIGIIEIGKAFQGGGWGMGILGALSLLFGVFLMFNNVQMALALPIVFGIIAVVFGGSAVIMALRVRSNLTA
ncbi:MAG: DUF308 domain-containing protein [Coriobacteriia bacterium]|nr:DUF308 domain-containing protein [Coriobacteriia bacterium]